MMKNLLFFIFISLIPQAQAALTLPEPAVLLKKASQGRIQLRDVILDISQQISEMRDPQTFEKYFYILPELKKYSDDFKLEDVYPKAVETLGLRMVAQGVRWLTLGKSTKPQIEYYFQWVDADVASNFLSAAAVEIRDEKDTQRLMQAMDNIEIIIPIIDAKFQIRFDLRQSARQMQSAIALKFLRTTISKADTLFWIKKLADINSMSEYAEFVQREVFTISKATPGRPHDLNEFLLLLSESSHKILTDPPISLDNLIGEIQVELILRMIRIEEVFVIGEFDKALSLLNSRQLQALASQWVTPDLLPTVSYAPHYMDLTKLLVRVLEKNGLKFEALELEKAVSRAGASIFAGTLKAEGTYELQDSKGRKFKFSIVEVRKGLLFAALVNEQEHIFRSFFYIGFNLTKNVFVALAREPDLDSSELPVAQFTIDSAGQINLLDIYAPADEKELKGKRTEVYESYQDFKSPTPVNLEGTYSGEFILPDKTKANLTLYITEINKESIGRLSGKSGRIYDFNYGTSVNQPYIYLTTGRLTRTTWVQVRAYFDKGKLKGKMIIGGRGISGQEFVLDKIN